jgi:hypothetical protein
MDQQRKGETKTTGSFAFCFLREWRTSCDVTILEMDREMWTIRLLLDTAQRNLCVPEHGLNRRMNNYGLIREDVCVTSAIFQVELYAGFLFRYFNTPCALRVS